MSIDAQREISSGAAGDQRREISRREISLSASRRPTRTIQQIRIELRLRNGGIQISVLVQKVCAICTSIRNRIRIDISHPGQKLLKLDSRVQMNRIILSTNFVHSVGYISGVFISFDGYLVVWRFSHDIVRMMRESLFDTTPEYTDYTSKILDFE